MKLFKIILIAVTASLSFAFNAGKNIQAYTETPEKTVIIKAGGANDANSFFSTNSIISFEIYKAGDQNKMQDIIKKISAVKGVDHVTAGKVTGDYSALSVALKSAKDKAYWKSLFKAAGLNHIKMNNNPVVEVEKL